MSDTLLAHICNAAGGHKHLARLTGSSTSSARRWRAGSAMPAAALLRLVQRSAAAREALLAALGLDDATCLARLERIEADLAALRGRRLNRQKESPHALASLDAGGRDRPHRDLVPGNTRQRGGRRDQPLCLEGAQQPPPCRGAAPPQAG